MADEKQLEILRKGVDVWNKWREDNPNIEIDLSGVELLEANLSDANLVAANLTDADLTGTKLIGTNFTEADLTGANLTETDLVAANFDGTKLIGANLSGTKLIGAFLIGADLTDSSIGLTAFGDNDLSASIGLETIEHKSFSIIGLDTIRASKSKIPAVFLRGCGLSDLDIEYFKLAAPGLDPEQVTQIAYEIHHLYLGQPLQFYSCFIIYNSKDYTIAKRLHEDLQDNGVRCWLATEDLKIGDQIRPTIEREIRLRDRLLVILSENSIKSEWVGDEVEAALEEESSSKRSVLFPVRLDDAVMSTRDDWAAKIKRRRHIGDFSNWQDAGSYRKAFERLLRDLKAK